MGAASLCDFVPEGSLGTTWGAEVEPSLEKPDQLIVFTLSDQRYAIPLSAVERAVRVAYVTALPKAPGIVLGVVNVQGRVIPVIDICQRFRLPTRPLAVTDQMLIAHTARRPVVLVVDAVTGVFDYSEQDVVSPQDVLPDIEYVAGVVRLEDGLILIHDLDRFLSIDEEMVLDRAMEND
jgi:purine-binding chemotaxis protein CheW